MTITLLEQPALSAAHAPGAIRALAALKGLHNVSEFARRLGMSRQMLDNRLTGETEFKIKELAAIADILGVTPNVLLLPARDAIRTALDEGFEPLYTWIDGFAGQPTLCHV